MTGLPEERSRRAWEAGSRAAPTSARRAGWSSASSGIDSRASACRRGRPRSHLYQLAHDGLLRRYQPITKRAEQLTHELDVIERTNLAEFFLIVWDLMEFARERGIIGQGGKRRRLDRGLLPGDHEGRPDRAQALFERFINEARALPDIDIDFDVNRREEVIQYLYTKYGADHAAMVCTIVTYRARTAVREVAKALGFPPEGIDALAKALDTRDATDVARDLALDGSFAWLFDELIDMATTAVPPGRDGRGTATCIPPPTRRGTTSRPTLDLGPTASARGPAKTQFDASRRSARTAGCRPGGRECSTHRSRRCGTSRGRPSATPAPVSSAASGAGLPTPRDNGSPGPSSGRPRLCAWTRNRDAGRGTVDGIKKL